MPTYEYICEACRHEFEKYQSIKSAPIRVCPRCGKRKVIRKISSGAGFIFKGGGFYETDYRSDNYKKGAEADKPKSETKPESESKPVETKVESKPVESKPEPKKSNGKSGSKKKK